MKDISSYNQFLDISPDVKKALENNQPVVALESTIISHGMPYPKNVETALKVEEIVRQNGAIPATIAIINGRLKAGLSKDEIILLGKQGVNITKVSRRDLPVVVGNKQNGATTVAATMIISELAGIRVFATGGIGGVHRGAEQTFDISADLQELAKTNVAVVCAGIKSILDLELTMEYLETFGIPVVGYQTEKLPSFFSRTSQFDVSTKLNTAEEIANMIDIKWKLNLNGGVVVANPIPKQYAMEETLISDVIEQAIKESLKKGIKGKETTPFLLSKIVELTGGNSLEANINLVFNNAKLASEIALHYCSIK